MKFADDEELKQFIEIATMLNYYKSKGVPIPEEVKDLIEQNRNDSEVCSVLNDIIHE